MLIFTFRVTTWDARYKCRAEENFPLSLARTKMLSKHATIPERMGMRFGCAVRSAEYSHRTRKRGLSLSFSPKKSFLSLCPSLLLSLEICTYCLCLLSSRLRQLLDWAINRRTVGLGPLISPNLLRHPHGFILPAVRLFTRSTE